jgi:multidrug resistance protein MdtO
MTTLAQSASPLDRQLGTAWDFLREELGPYPGRGSLVARMVISSVIVMLLIMTFRIPGAALAAYFTLVLSRESPEATLAGAIELILACSAGGAYVLLSALIFFGSPGFQFLWVIGSFFVMFFVIRTLRNYGTAAAFGFIIATCIPIWERRLPSERSVEATLWTAGSVAIGCAVTVVVEYLAAPLRRVGPLESGVLERWHTIAAVLRSAAQSEVAGEPGKKLTQFVVVGVSRLRRLTLRSGRGVAFNEQAGALVSITERLVDLTAALVQLRQSFESSEQNRMLQAASAIEAMAERLSGSRDQPEAPLRTPATGQPSRLPFLPEIERNITLLADALEMRGEVQDTPIRTKPTKRLSLFLQDTWTNPDHLAFALKGCLAATICYVIYNAIDWPGLNTSVATCLITALSSIGSSRQKQILRMAGTIAGGVIFGMGAQVSLLPRMDSITAFTLFFASVTAIAAWFATASARISYFGLQLALAFFLINLQEFAFQTSLTIARDRVLGVLLALFVMWIVFDLLGGVPAVNQMLAQFQRVLLRLAELEELSLASDAEIISTREQEIREELVGAFAAINAEADAVLLETGPQRSEHLLLRKRIMPLLPALRSLLLLQVTALQYRRQRLIGDLPPSLAAAHQNFARAVAGFLRELASNYPAQRVLPEFRALDALHKAVKEFYDQTSGGVLPSPVIALEALADSIASTLKSMQVDSHVAS